MHVEKYRQGRYWAAYDAEGRLICVTLYRKGAQEVVRRLQGRDSPPPAPAAGTPPGPSPATRRRWRRALAIAAILMEEEGYHTGSIKAISQALTQG
jgi:YD repeat-containing protein